jgi:hypothetical protein
LVEASVPEAEAPPRPSSSRKEKAGRTYNISVSRLR